jgi:hypothetical protein
MPRTSHACAIALGLLAAAPAPAQLSNVSENHKYSWSENCGWMNWRDSGSPGGTQGVLFRPTFAQGLIWCENIGYVNIGNGPADGQAYDNLTGADFGVNIGPNGVLTGMAWGENVGWLSFSAAGQLPRGEADPARIDVQQRRLRGWVWGENIGWVNLDDANAYVAVTGLCGTADFDSDGDVGTDADIESFFACLAGTCCPTCGSADFDGDGDVGTDADIEAFFRVLSGGIC